MKNKDKKDNVINFPSSYRNVEVFSYVISNMDYIADKMEKVAKFNRYHGRLQGFFVSSALYTFIACLGWIFTK